LSDWRSVIDKQPTRAHPHLPTNKPPFNIAAHRASAPLDEMMDRVQHKPFVEDSGPKVENPKVDEKPANQ